MIGVFFDIEYEGIAANPPRGWKTVRRDAYKEAARSWHKLFAKRHFSHAGAKRYGYLKRQGEEHAFGSKQFKRSYTGRKFAKYRHTNPLQYTGQTKQDVLTKWRVQSKRDGSAVVIMNARGLNRRPKGGRINMRAEMERVTSDEVSQLAVRAEKRANRDLKKLQRTRRRRKRIGG